MEDVIAEKLESYRKYIPFLRFVVSLDGKKYKHFDEILSWIVDRRRFQIHIWNRLERVIWTQYKYILRICNNIPDGISEVFEETIDLSSDSDVEIVEYSANPNNTREDRENSNDDETVNALIASKIILLDLTTEDDEIQNKKNGDDKLVEKTGTSTNESVDDNFNTESNKSITERVSTAKVILSVDLTEDNENINTNCTNRNPQSSNLPENETNAEKQSQTETTSSEKQNKVPSIKLNLKDPRIVKQLKLLQNSPLLSSKSKAVVNRRITSNETTLDTNVLELINLPVNDTPRSSITEENSQQNNSSTSNKHNKSNSSTTDSSTSNKHNKSKNSTTDRSTSNENASGKKTEEELTVENNMSKLFESCSDNENANRKSSKKKRKHRERRDENNKDHSKKNKNKNNKETLKENSLRNISIDEAEDSDGLSTSQLISTKFLTEKKVAKTLKSLECTFKGYESIYDVVPKKSVLKRHSSVAARDAISQQFNHATEDGSKNTDVVDNNISKELNSLDCTFKDLESVSTPKKIGLKRRSSIAARDAISQQYNVLSRESSINREVVDNNNAKELKSLDCTLKGYESIAEPAPKSIARKRRSSVAARDAINQQYNVLSRESSTNREVVDNNNAKELKSLEFTFKGFESIAEPMPKSIARKRRSSVAARDAISQQYNALSRESSTNREIVDNNNAKELKSLEFTFKGYESVSELTSSTVGPKRRSCIAAQNAISMILNQSPLVQNSLNNSTILNSTSKKQKLSMLDESYSVTEALLPKYQPMLRLHRLSQKEIQMHCHPQSSKNAPPKIMKLLPMQSDTSSNTTNVTGTTHQPSKSVPPNTLLNKELVPMQSHTSSNSSDTIRKTTLSSNTVSLNTLLNVQLVPIDLKSKEATTKVQAVKKTAATKKQSTRKQQVKNTNVEMTERNTTFCTLCRSKPADLTNHYIRVHKTESYIARMTLFELENLDQYTNFVKEMGFVSSNVRVMKYQTRCSFCDDELTDYFDHFYMHYSTHTGEYAYGCDKCNLLKPFPADIKSHIHHSKLCRKASVKMIYRYPKNAMAIYLYNCKLCNFVQLNESNICKHLRENHKKTSISNVYIGKHILAAKFDEESTSVTLPTPPIDINYSKNHNINGNNLFQLDNQIVVNNEPLLDNDVEERNELISSEKTNCNRTLLLSTDQKEISENSSEMELQVHSDLKICVPQLLSSKMETEKALSIATSKNVPVLDNALVRQVSKNIAVNNCTIDNNLTRPIPHENYKLRGKHKTYFGLFKCMASDCMFSTNKDHLMIQHCKDHVNSICPPENIIKCAYCTWNSTDEYDSPRKLVKHVLRSHSGSFYQCMICAFRSCEARKVLIHQTLRHSKTTFAYVCVKFNKSKKKTDLTALLTKNVQPIQCSECQQSFYSIESLKQHLKCHRDNVDKDILQQTYACIYCTKNYKHKRVLKTHLAIFHPDDTSHACQRHLIQKPDKCANLMIINLFEDVTPNKIKYPEPLEDEIAIVKEVMDVKPNIKQLIDLNTEIIKPLLCKVTENTGVPPNSLYQCPIANCGGFYSNFSLWDRHMKIRHNCLLANCPHCDNELSLDQFEEHFELHCRHTFLCFHCKNTFVNERELRAHDVKFHSSIPHVRIEQIVFSFNYSYFVLIDNNLYQEKNDFLINLQKMLKERISAIKTEHDKMIFSEWIIPMSNASWLDDYPSYATLSSRCSLIGCLFQSNNVELVIRHMLEHVVTLNPHSGITCNTCSKVIGNLNSVASIEKHLKLHASEIIFICSFCNFYHFHHQDILDHISTLHNLRDVPFIRINRTKNCNYVSVYMDFAKGQLTFSTFKHCFVCDKHITDVEKLMIHLKKDHNFNFVYFCEICKLSCKLKDMKSHYKNAHKSQDYKIRCQFRTNNQLEIVSVNPFKINVKIGKLTDKLLNGITKIKKEHIDEEENDELIELDEDDIIIAELAKANRSKELQNKRSSEFKCVNIEQLLVTETNIQTTQNINISNPINLSTTTNSTAPTLSPSLSNCPLSNIQSQSNSSQILSQYQQQFSKFTKTPSWPMVKLPQKSIKKAINVPLCPTNPTINSKQNYHTTNQQINEVSGSTLNQLTITQMITNNSTSINSTVQINNLNETITNNANALTQLSNPIPNDILSTSQSQFNRQITATTYPSNTPMEILSNVQQESVEVHRLQISNNSNVLYNSSLATAPPTELHRADVSHNTNVLYNSSQATAPPTELHRTDAAHNSNVLYNSSPAAARPTELHRTDAAHNSNVLYNSSQAAARPTELHRTDFSNNTNVLYNSSQAGARPTELHRTDISNNNNTLHNSSQTAASSTVLHHTVNISNSIYKPPQTQTGTFRELLTSSNVLQNSSQDPRLQNVNRNNAEKQITITVRAPNTLNSTLENDYTGISKNNSTYGINTTQYNCLPQPLIRPSYLNSVYPPTTKNVPMVTIPSRNSTDYVNSSSHSRNQTLLALLSKETPAPKVFQPPNNAIGSNIAARPDMTYPPSYHNSFMAQNLPILQSQRMTDNSNVPMVQLHMYNNPYRVDNIN